MSSVPGGSSIEHAVASGVMPRTIRRDIVFGPYQPREDGRLAQGLHVSDAMLAALESVYKVHTGRADKTLLHVSSETILLGGIRAANLGYFDDVLRDMAMWEAGTLKLSGLAFEVSLRAAAKELARKHQGTLIEFLTEFLSTAAHQLAARHVYPSSSEEVPAYVGEKRPPRDIKLTILEDNNAELQHKAIEEFFYHCLTGVSQSYAAQLVSYIRACPIAADDKDIGRKLRYIAPVIAPVARQIIPAREENQTIHRLADEDIAKLTTDFTFLFQLPADIINDIVDLIVLNPSWFNAINVAQISEASLGIAAENCRIEQKIAQIRALGENVSTVFLHEINTEYGSGEVLANTNAEQAYIGVTVEGLKFICLHDRRNARMAVMFPAVTQHSYQVFCSLDTESPPAAADLFTLEVRQLVVVEALAFYLAKESRNHAQVVLHLARAKQKELPLLRAFATVSRLLASGLLLPTYSVSLDDGSVARVVNSTKNKDFHALTKSDQNTSLLLGQYGIVSMLRDAWTTLHILIEEIIHPPAGLLGGEKKKFSTGNEVVDKELAVIIALVKFFGENSLEEAIIESFGFAGNPAAKARTDKWIECTQKIHDDVAAFLNYLAPADHLEETGRAFKSTDQNELLRVLRSRPELTNIELTTPAGAQLFSTISRNWLHDSIKPNAPAPLQVLPQIVHDATHLEVDKFSGFYPDTFYASAAHIALPGSHLTRVLDRLFLITD